MRKKLVYLAAMLTASVSATSANAAQFLTLTGPSGTFGDDQVVCTEAANTGPCSFTRSFEFVTPAGFNLASIDISSIATANPLTNIDFSSVTFNGVSFANLSSGTSEFRNLLNQNLVTTGNNILRVAGTTGGNASFAGNISLAAAVPEPTTWMLMLLGMAGIGFSMRRKEKQTLRVRYT